MLILSAGELQIRPNGDPLTEGRQSTESHGLSSCKKSQATERTTLCYMIFAEKVLPLQVGQ